MIVLTISAILAMIALPNMAAAIAQKKAADVAQKVFSGAQWARFAAINSRTVAQYTANADCSWTTIIGTGGQSGDAVMPNGVSCSVANPGAIYFLPDGRITQASPTPLTLTNPIVFTVTGGGLRSIITINPMGVITYAAQ
jgi:type II secretory pathway pseudopilin PulG